MIGTPDPALLPALSQLALCLLIELDGADARIEVYADGAAAALETALAPFAHTSNCLDTAPAGDNSSPALGEVALDALPQDVQALAQRVDLKQANAMFSRLSGSLMKKTGGDPGDLLRQPEWSSAGGARISALMDCLDIPDWRAPDFVTLRDAYALHERKRRSPKAMLYPGDAEALAAVPDALMYTPIYGGKS